MPGPRVDRRDRGRGGGPFPAAGGPGARGRASRIGTDDGLALATGGRDVITTCACVSVNLSLEPAHMRFVHDLQAASGAPPGPFAVEAYDAGRFLLGLVTGAGSDDLRQVLAAALEEPAEIPGLAGSYGFEPDGSRAEETITVGAAGHGLSLAARRTCRRSIRLTALPGDRSCPRVRP